MAAKRIPAVSYLRVSGVSQVSGDGFDRQKESIARFAKASKIEVVDEFIDEGISGTRDAEARPGLAAVLERIEHNCVRIVLVERADRLARDLLVSEVILEQFRRLGCKVIECEGGSDLTVADGEPTKILIRQILGAVAEFEKSVLSLKLRAARDRVRRREGRCEGVKPFGALPGEDVVLERIRALRRKPAKGEQLSFARIADALNAEGLPTRKGGPWRPSAVGAILSRG